VRRRVGVMLVMRSLDRAVNAPPHRGMEHIHGHAQRIDRLTPLADVLARIEQSVNPVAPSRCVIGSALSRVLAEDVIAPAQSPARPLALRDGWAVRAEETTDAGSYTPALLATLPTRIDAGDPLPPATDAVASLDSINLRDGPAEALAACAPGDGVLAAGGDTEKDELLLPAGLALRRIDIATLRALGIAEVMVREPRVCVITVRSDAMLEAIADFLAETIAAEGGRITGRSSAADGLAPAISAAAADAICVIGGTGTGRNDDSVWQLASLGRIAAHGIAVAPGETAAFGFAGRIPVLLVPGRLDAAVATWLTLGRPLLARAAGRKNEEAGRSAVLTRKASSNLGLSEIVLVGGKGNAVEPLASGYLPLAALARAEGWIIIPADSEGYPAGTRIEVKPLP
jgi:molybdopterin molybdotransferase